MMDKYGPNSGQVAPTTPEVLEWMRTWTERNPEKAKRFARYWQAKRQPRINGRFVKRNG